MKSHCVKRAIFDRAKCSFCSEDCAEQTARKLPRLRAGGRRWIGGWAIGLLSCCWIAAPAAAGQLSTLQFDAGENQLEFNTDEDVQPRAQLVADPTRLVIDLPGTTVGQVPSNQAIGQVVQQIRVGQLDAQTTRIVVELAPGYTIDPQQIRFRGISPTHWTVQLPEPQAVPIASTQPSAQSLVTQPRSAQPRAAQSLSAQASSTQPPVSSITLSASAPAVSSADPSLTQIEGLQVTADGLFVQTSGARAEVEVNRRRRHRETITITIDKATLSPQFAAQTIALNQYGISTLEFSQSSEGSPSVQITLQVAEESPDWQAFASGSNGIVMLPQGGVRAVAGLSPPAARSDGRSESRPEIRPETSSNAARSRDRTTDNTTDNQAVPATPQAPDAMPDAMPDIATISGVELNSASNQLLIHSDRPVTSSGRWQSGAYQVTLSPARLADNVTGSQIGGANSPVLRVRLRQQSEDTVIATIQPATGVRFGNLNMVSSQLLALEVQRSQPMASPPSAPPSSPPAVPADRLPSITLPSVESGRLVVVIDPGHGGSDPGAIGINGIQEKQIVLAISQQVAAYLGQQGVQVVMTRTDDRDVELEPRVQMAEQVNASLFVSIHANAISLDRPDVNGVETYFYSSGEQMAEVIQESLVQGTGMNDKGTQYARFYVLRRTSMPAVLIETGFVTGSEDAPRLSDPGFQTQMAMAIAQGILRYVQQNSTAQN